MACYTTSLLGVERSEERAYLFFHNWCSCQRNSLVVVEESLTVNLLVTSFTQSAAVCHAIYHGLSINAQGTGLIVGPSRGGNAVFRVQRHGIPVSLSLSLKSLLPCSHYLYAPLLPDYSRPFVIILNE